MIVAEPAVLSAVAAGLLAGSSVVLMRHRQRRRRIGKRDTEAAHDAAGAGGQRLVVQEWRDGDLVMVGAIVIEDRSEDPR